MDPILAKRMEGELTGKHVGPWLIGGFLGNGNSAVVFRATYGGREAALKVFDPDLVARVTEAVQLGRIEREKRLIGKRHDNLVQIYDGGKCEQTNYLFLAMELIDAPDLEKVLTEVPHDRIRSLIAQLARAAKFLDDLGLVHRDIKPANIAVSRDFQRLTLLDTGIIRPVGEKGLTDVGGQHFIGTKRYSPPEFMRRGEDDSPDGWQAVSFYQIGAVLHDLLTKKRIFEEHSTPEDRLMDAVKFVHPFLDVPGADPELVALASCCLSKDPAVRLKMLTWNSFDPPPLKTTAASMKDRLLKRQAGAAVPTAGPVTTPSSLRRTLDDLVNRITGIVRDEVGDNSDVLPPVGVHDHPHPDAYAAAFRAAFPKSPAKGITNAFALAFRITVIDADVKLVEITASAAIAGDVKQFSAEGYGPSIAVYKGLFVEDLVRNQIRLALFAGVEAAMGYPTVGHDEINMAAIQIPDMQE